MDIPLSPLLTSMSYHGYLDIPSQMQGNDKGFDSRFDTATSDFIRTVAQLTPSNGLNKEILHKTLNTRIEMQQAMQEKHMEGLKSKQAFQQVSNKLKQMKEALDSIG